MERSRDLMQQCAFPFPPVKSCSMLQTYTALKKVTSQLERSIDVAEANLQADEGLSQGGETNAGLVPSICLSQNKQVQQCRVKPWLLIRL